MIYHFDNNKELLLFKSSPIVANTEDAGSTNRKILRAECLKQFQEMNRSNKRSTIKIEGRRTINYEIITKHANTKKGSYSK